MGRRRAKMLSHRGGKKVKMDGDREKFKEG